MERITKKGYYLGIAKAVCKRSSCLRRRYGCIIVKNDEIIATGYNGSARGCINCCDKFKICPRKNEEHNSGDYSNCEAVHAEQNAMLSAARKDMIGATMYLYGEEFKLGTCFELWDVWEEIKNPEPCPICKRMIQNAGIERVITNGNN